MRPDLPLILAVSASVAGSPAPAAPSPAVTLALKDHSFTPATVTIPAGQRVAIRLINHDPASEEFDSDDLGVEQEVSPMGVVNFYIGPLKPGTYAFMGEFHPNTAQGVVKVEATAVAPPQPRNAP